MNDAIEYIEVHLNDSIDMDVVARKACCSIYNFQRVFSYITGVTLNEYIRRRRLTLAAFEIHNNDKKIIDIALDYGYESPVSFARAFLNQHGITPSQARRDGHSLKAFPRMTFQVSIKGVCEMDYRIETKEGFKIFGMESDIGFDSNPAEFWKVCHENGSYEKLFNNVGSLPSFVSQDLCKIHGAVNYKRVTDGYSYMLFGFDSPDSKTDDYSVVEIPAQTYAIFPSKKFKWDEDFKNVLSELQKRFYTEWLPTSNYQKVDGPEFEIYGGYSEFGYIELWYPVQKHK